MATSVSTLDQVLACCLTVPSHYLNQCWLLITKLLWHSPECNFTASAKTTILYHEYENYTFEVAVPSLISKWISRRILCGAALPPTPVTTMKPASSIKPDGLLKSSCNFTSNRVVPGFSTTNSWKSTRTLPFLGKDVHNMVKFQLYNHGCFCPVFHIFQYSY